MAHKIFPQLKPMTPLEVYLQQVKGVFGQVRANNEGMSYYPPQFGGIFGQRTVNSNTIVLEVTDFEVKGS